MAKKSNVNIPFIVVIRIIIFLFLGLVLFGAATRTVEFLNTSKIFAVREVLLDASVQFIDVSELRRLQGRNIFQIDIGKLHKRIKSQYPQLAQLRVIRDLPDRIKVLAQKREVLFQVPWKGEFLLIDDKSVAMYAVPAALDIPTVQGVLPLRGSVVLGGILTSKSMRTALTILGGFKQHSHLSRLNIKSIDMRNPSKIDVTLSAGLLVILDQDHYGPKLELLEMLLAAKKIDFNRVQYVDLRFNQPVLGGN